jgi:Na+/melibiose symporter-like transporter
MFGTISFLIVAFFTTISILMTAKHIPDLPSGTDTPEQFTFRKIFLDIGHALQNRNFRNLFWVMLTLGAGAGVGGALGTHMATYFWELTTQQLFYQTLFTFVPIAFMLGIMTWLSKKFEKHIILQICTFIFAANGIWLIALRLLDILPANGHAIIFPLILVGVFIGSANLIWFQTMVSSVIADIGDEQEYLTHERQEGMFFAAQGFSIKFVSGVGNFVGGVVLEFIELPVNAAPGTVSAEVLFKMGVVVGPVLTVFTIIPFLFARRITMTRARHDEIRAVLDERAASTQSAG